MQHFFYLSTNTTKSVMFRFSVFLLSSESKCMFVCGLCVISVVSLEMQRCLSSPSSHLVLGYYTAQPGQLCVQCFTVVVWRNCVPPTAGDGTVLCSK